ncbi:MAG: hypothetical protein ONB31_01005 [candidate division KSB1 bacterium]|nr:hypothetical protein [candidate division KSB1 bacterium]MDZ7334892.1 hypothetical protein [candidate division KSB1 bacterium]MDZ7358826.1 hypothetical protein [candidate division KSB1 bacterium]MDZ7399348.1 hypothetical protein [candidate division KSB1 bacterium]
MNLHNRHFQHQRASSHRYRIILSSTILIIATTYFLYFFIVGNFPIHYIVALGSLWLFFCGIFIAFIGYLLSSEKFTELTFEQVLKQMRRWAWVSIAGLYGSSLSFFSGLIFFARSGDVWRNSLPLFATSVLCLAICILGLLQRTAIKHRYELEILKREILDTVISLRQGPTKDVKGGALLA